MKIYVGNLAYRTVEDGLREAFEQFGAVESVAIVKDRETGRSKGFGFVEMPNEEEAHRAIEGLNDQELDQRPLKVNEARASEPRTGGYRGGSRGGYGGDRGGDRGPRRYGN